MAAPNPPPPKPTRPAPPPAPAAPVTPAPAAAPAADPAYPPGADVVAKASTEYRIKRYIMVFILVGAGAWFGYDGFVGWPNENAKVDDLDRRIAEAQAGGSGNEDVVKKLTFEKSQLKRHTDMDLLFQRVLCLTLPPLGLAVLAFALHNSRGRYLLRDHVLSVPGHPPVPLDLVTAVDKTHWERKGIAYLDYELPNGKTGRLRLDDFIYQRPPTDEIFKRVEDYLGTADEGAPAA